MNIEIDLIPGMIIESFNELHNHTDYSALRRFKLISKDENHLEENSFGEFESLWMVNSGNLTMWLFESEIKMHYWIAGTNHNLDYSSFKIIEA